MSGPGPVHSCALCDHPSVGHVNGVYFCRTHSPDVLRLHVNIDAFERGVDPDTLERVVDRLLSSPPEHLEERPDEGGG
jgi:hypothetical protein